MSDAPTGPVLDYSHDGGVPQWTSLHQFFSESEAQLAANELDAQSIRYQLWNGSTQSTLGLYGAVVKVDLQVPSDDLARARTILADHLRPEAAATLEPAESEDPSQPRETTDEAGQPIELLAVQSFDSAANLREAALVLESARLEAYVPRLVQRGSNPPGQGFRFVLRVRAEDVARARAVLNRDDGESDSDEPRCPNCGSWNVHEVKHELTNLFLGLVGKSRPDECECLKCHTVGLKTDFLRHETDRP